MGTKRQGRDAAHAARVQEFCRRSEDHDRASRQFGYHGVYLQPNIANTPNPSRLNPRAQYGTKLSFNSGIFRSIGAWCILSIFANTCFSASALSGANTSPPVNTVTLLIESGMPSSLMWME